MGGSVGHVAAACVAELLATRGPAGCWCWLGANDSPPQRGRDLLIPPVLGDCLLFLLSCSYFSPLIPRLSGLSPRFWTSYFHPIILSSYHPKSCFVSLFVLRCFCFCFFSEQVVLQVFYCFFDASYALYQALHTSRGFTIHDFLRM